MTDRKDYYKILGVSKDATPDEIKKVYRKLAKKFHPDKHQGDKTVEAKFKEINEAYAVLHDTKKRRDYDLGERVTFDGWPGGGFGGGQPQGFDFGTGGGMEDLFAEIFSQGGHMSHSTPGARGGRAQRRPPVHGTNIEFKLGVDFMHAVKGAEVALTVKRSSGNEKIKVTIPSGINDGDRVRVPSKGNPGQFGGPSGDLFVTVTTKPHKYLTRKDNNIYLDVPVTIAEAAFGATIEIPTISGTTKIKIPPGTQGGQKLRIKGKGVVIGRTAGHQYVIIKIVIPEKTDKRTTELIKELESINPYDPRVDLW